MLQQSKWEQHDLVIAEQKLYPVPKNLKSPTFFIRK